MIKLKEAAQEKLYHKELLTNNLDETVFFLYSKISEKIQARNVGMIPSKNDT